MILEEQTKWDSDGSEKTFYPILQKFGCCRLPEINMNTGNCLVVSQTLTCSHSPWNNFDHGTVLAKCLNKGCLFSGAHLKTATLCRGEPCCKGNACLSFFLKCENGEVLSNGNFWVVVRIPAPLSMSSSVRSRNHKVEAFIMFCLRNGHLGLRKLNPKWAAKQILSTATPEIDAHDKKVCADILFFFGRTSCSGVSDSSLKWNIPVKMEGHPKFLLLIKKGGKGRFSWRCFLSFLGLQVDSWPGVQWADHAAGKLLSSLFVWLRSHVAEQECGQLASCFPQSLGQGSPPGSLVYFMLLINSQGMAIACEALLHED